jgi:hypothetical protein
MQDYFDDCDDKYEEMRDEGWRWGEPHTRPIRLPKYKKNLRADREYVNGETYIQVYSYDTHVAHGKEAGGILTQPQWYSATTQKHVNHVASLLGMKVVKLF